MLPRFMQGNVVEITETVIMTNICAYEEKINVVIDLSAWGYVNVLIAINC